MPQISVRQDYGYECVKKLVPLSLPSFKIPSNPGLPNDAPPGCPGLPDDGPSWFARWPLLYYRAQFLPRIDQFSKGLLCRAMQWTDYQLQAGLL